PPLASANPLMHEAGRKMLADVLACIRHGVTVQQAGSLLEANAARHLLPVPELARLFRGREAALEAGMELASRCSFSLDELRYEYPDEICPPGTTAQAHLAALTWEGAARRYPAGIPEAVRLQIERELHLIGELGYQHYFLTVHDLVAF